MLRSATLVLVLATLSLAGCSSGGRCDPLLDCSPPVPGCDCSAVDAGTDADAGETNDEADAGTGDDQSDAGTAETCPEGAQLDLTGHWVGDLTTTTGTGWFEFSLTHSGSALTGAESNTTLGCGELTLNATVDGCKLEGSVNWTEIAGSVSQFSATATQDAITGTFTPDGQVEIDCQQLTGSFTLSRKE